MTGCSFKNHFREWSVASALFLLLLTLALAAPQFFKPNQLMAILTSAAPVLIVACGIAVVIICRQIDISVGSQFSICSLTLGLLVQAHVPPWVAGVLAMVVGGMMGAVNGFLVAGLGLPSIVVTLATMVTWREALRWGREGEFVRDLPENFQWFGLGQLKGEWLVLTITGLGFLAIVFIMKNFTVGRYVYAVGSDAEAARLAGVRPNRVTFMVFILMGVLVGLAALLNGVRFGDMDPKTGTGLELQTIAAAVVGGVAVSGGRGNLWGVLAGVVLLACIGPALVFLRLQPQWEKCLQGSIILLAVAADGWRARRKGNHFARQKLMT